MIYATTTCNSSAFLTRISERRRAMLREVRERERRVNVPRSMSPQMCPVCLRCAVRPTMMSRECLWRLKSRFAVAARLGSSRTSLSGTRLDAMLGSLQLGCDVIERTARLTAAFITDRSQTGGRCEGMHLCISGREGRGWIIDETLQKDSIYIFVLALINRKLPTSDAAWKKWQKSSCFNICLRAKHHYFSWLQNTNTCIYLFIHFNLTNLLLLLTFNVIAKPLLLVLLLLHTNNSQINTEQLTMKEKKSALK